MTTQGIKPGYKQSPLGIIPQNRDVYELKDLFDFHKGQGLSKEMVEDNGKNECILYGELYTHYNQIINNVKSRTNSDEGLKSIKGDILIPASTTTSAYDLATAAVINKSNVLLGGDINILRKKDINFQESNICGEFFSNYLTFNKKQEISKYGQGITIIHLYAKDFSDMLVHLPPLQEQEAIAKILGKVDKTIEKTQNMIEKLELRNKGLEQKLLTGKIRLKGFNGEFKKLSADRIFKSVSIKNLPNEELLSATQEQGIIPRSMLEQRVTMPTSEAKSYKLVVPGNFVISLRSFQGGLEYSKYRGIVSPAYTVLDHILPICYDYYKYYFKSYDFIGHLSIAVIGIRDGKQISFDDFCTLNLPYPGIEEQKAIANILNKANKQLNKYEQKLEKLQELKKGLMQQLLTGKVRVKEFRN